MQDFHCQFNAEGQNTGFSLENRLVFDAADQAAEDTPAQGSEKLSETDRLAHLNSHLDDLDNLIKEGRLPESEDEMIKYHLARNIVRTDEDIDEFFRSSRQNLGFTIEDGKYNMNGVQAVEASDTGLYAFLERNLKAHAKDSGMEDIGNEDVRPEDIAKDIIAEAKIAKGNYDFLSKNYASFEEFKEDFEKVVTLREMAKVKRDYEGAREKTVTRTKIKESELAFETKVQIVKNKATTATQAALLWYAINFNPEMSYENLNLEDIFNPRDIEENGIAIVNGRLVVAYKPKDKPLPEGVQYEYATYGYNQYNIDPAIQLLRDQNNEYGGKKGAEIADLLESGVAIFEGLEIETEDIIKSYEANEVFQTNYELLQRIMLVPEGMLNAEIGLQGDESLGLAPIENIPDFAKEGGPWYFGRIGGKFYARTIHFVDRGECYVFDMQKGWENTDRIPEMEFAMPELYREKDDGTWEVNRKALEMAKSLELNADEVLVRTLNVLCKKTARNPFSRAKLLDAFAFNPIPGAMIPFPKLDKVEILLDSENYADSLTNIQDILHTTYVQRFPGLDYNTAHWLAGDIGQRFIESLSLVDSRTGKPYVVDQNGNPIDSEHKYILSSKKVADNFLDAFRPDVEFTAEKQFSAQTKARIDQIQKYIESMYSGFFGKINNLLGAKFGVVGETIGQFVEEWARQPLGDVWKLAEELSEEWETLEGEKGKTLTFKEFMIIYGVQALGKLKDPSKIEEGSFLDRVYKMFNLAGGSQIPQTAPTEQQQERSPLDVTDAPQLEMFKDRLENLKYSFGRKRGQNIFTNAEIADMIEEVGNMQDTSFTNDEQRNYVLRKMKAKLDPLQGDAKTAMQAEYDYLKSGTVPPEYATTAAGAVAAAGAPATPGQPSPEIAAGDPGSSPDNPKEISAIDKDGNYFGWHKAKQTITIRSGQFKVDDLNFINKDADGQPNFDPKVRIEIVYKEANTDSDIASTDGKMDTYDYMTSEAASALFTDYNNSLAIGKPSNRITKSSGTITPTQDTIEEIRIYPGVGLKNPHLNNLT